jgi:hypothetical protein
LVNLSGYWVWIQFRWLYIAPRKWFRELKNDACYTIWEEVVSLISVRKPGISYG